jgi:hypothetical protein
VEPLGADVPAGTGLTLSTSTTIRLGAGAAALLLAVLSRGDVLVLAVLLAVIAWRPLAVIAVGPALVAGGWRWGSTALEAIAGAQAVLGPAGTVGSTASAASAWVAAGAVVLVTPDLCIGSAGRWWRRPHAAAASPGPGLSPRSVWAPAVRLLVAAAVGTTAAAIATGPAPGGAMWARVVGSVVATVAALVVATARRRDDSGRRWSTSTWLDAAATVAGIGALALAAADAPPWAGTIDGAALRSGAVLAVASVALLVAAVGAVGALHEERHRRVGSLG